MALQRELATVIKSANTMEIIKFLDDHHSEMKEPQINWILSSLLPEFETDGVASVLEHYLLINVLDLSLERAVLSLTYLVQSKKHHHHEAVSLYEQLESSGKTRKKHLIIVLQALIAAGDYEQAAKLFLGSMNKYDLTGDDLERFKNAPIHLRSMVLETGFRKPLFVSSDCWPSDCISFKAPVCPATGKLLETIDFTSSEMSKLLTEMRAIFASKKRATEFDLFISSELSSLKYVIDGANIMYYGERVVNFNSYSKLDLLIKDLSSKVDDSKEICLVLHQRHFNPKFKNKKETRICTEMLTHWAKQITICKTPTGLNDDWFSILSAIRSNAILISNDKFRDHIFSHSLLKQWVHERVVGFKFLERNKVIVVAEPPSWSNRIQKSSVSGKTYYLLPTTGGGDVWLQVPE